MFIGCTSPSCVPFEKGQDEFKVFGDGAGAVLVCPGPMSCRQVMSCLDVMGGNSCAILLTIT